MNWLLFGISWSIRHSSGLRLSNSARCLARLPLTENVSVISPRELLYDPITSLVIGVIVLVWVTAQINLLPKKFQNPDEEKAET